jgi:rhodanese-related sulfurtransferase
MMMMIIDDSQTCYSQVKLHIQVVVIDVRDEDYEGGHIKTSIRSPFAAFDNNVHQLIQKVIQEDKKKHIVFTCMYSEQRYVFTVVVCFACMILIILFVINIVHHHVLVHLQKHWIS